MAENLSAPLNGIKVLDLTEDRGLYAGKMLADLGADVIKIENPGGSKARRVGPFKDDVPNVETSLYFINFNTNKRGITLDIHRDAGLEIFKKLVAKADVVIEDFPAGETKSLGLDYPVLCETNQRLIMASLTGFGPTGPYSSYKAPDIVNFAAGGLMQISGPHDEPPVVAPGEQAYQITSIIAVFGVLSAIFHHMRTGEGQHIDTSAHEIMTVTNSSLLTYSTSSGLGVRAGSQFGASPARIYPCKDGYIHLMVLRPNHWKSFLEMMGNPEVFSDQAWYESNFRGRNADLVDSLVTEFTMTRTKADITRECQDRGIPCVPVYSHAEFANDPHVKERGFIKQLEHPVIGKHSLLGSPYGFSKSPVQIYRPAPMLGQHNEEVYCGELGYSREGLVELKSRGII